MEKNQKKDLRPGAREGIALVIVLGVLSLMVMMGVAFCVAVRIETLASANYADIVRARQMVYVGLARALDWIRADLGTNMLVGGRPAPLWNVTNQCPLWNNTDYLVNNTNFLRGEAGWHVPGVHAVEAANINAVFTAMPWQVISYTFVTNVTTTTDPYTGLPVVSTNLSSAKIAGIVAYMIFNCSGLLDANYVGGSDIRRYGSNPNEIAIANLPEIGNGGATDFFDKRDQYVRYETLHELAVLDAPPENLFVYSYCPPGYLDLNGTQILNQVNLAGTADQLENIPGRRDAIIAGFVQAGFATNDAWTLYDNLIDYVDDDDEPHHFTWFVESVPMINEMVFSNIVTYSAGPPEEWNVNCGASFELWYPFVSGGGTYSFTATVAFASLAGTLLVGGQQNNRALSPAQPFDVISFSASTEYNSDPEKFTVRIDDARVMSGTNKLDNLNPCIVVSGMAKDAIVGLECLDPRFNRDPDSALWRVETTTPTWREINSWTSTYLQSPTNNGDTDAKMYVANKPLQSVGELGYLMYASNAPWHTIKLYGVDTNLCRVLDVFAMGTNGTDVYVTHARRGLVNFNTNAARDALAAVFAGMPVDYYPGELSAPKLDWASAQSIADRIFSGGIYTNLSDLGRGLVDFSGLTSSGGNISVDSEFQREAFFRNAAGLLTTRQNLFAIIIEVNPAYGGAIVPRNAAKQRAVAIVWRDAFTGDFFLRSLKWLQD